ncbi:hypothetical protein E2651_05640 [Streptomyces sp. MZ04]|nr:hypothetical protein E2651_05640 [Streptomyces sp. MZ04]
MTRLNFSKIFKDTSGGAYSYLDNEDRLVLADSRQHIVRLAHEQTADGSWRFVVDKDWDLTEHVPHDCVTWSNLYPSGECDPVTSVMPDWEGRIWWVTRQGRVGTVDPESGDIRRGADAPDDKRLVCKVPVFGSGASTTDNSLISWGDSLVVENNYGYENITSPLTAVDFRTGETKWKRLAGTGIAYDNNWAPVTLGPDGTVYVGVFNGLVAVRDTE